MFFIAVNQNSGTPFISVDVAVVSSSSLIASEDGSPFSSSAARPASNSSSLGSATPLTISALRLYNGLYFSKYFFSNSKISSWNLSSSLERSEEHTSELQSPCNLVCRLLLEKKNKITCAKTTLVQ